MKISIITTCFNSAKTIEDTIKSVLSQEGIDLEYIIVDGGSTDGTLNIINRYKDRITKIISEPDKSLYDGMNKGLKLAAGDVVGIINSDDFYHDKLILNKIVGIFGIEKDVDACYGDLLYVDQKNIKKIVRRWRAGEMSDQKINSGWTPPHPTFFVRRLVYEKYGHFNLNFRMAADYELLLRFIKKGGIKLRYIPEDLVYMRAGGYSASSIRNRMLGWRELRLAWKINGLDLPFLFILCRIISKLKQYIV